jgi:hypothetical protein
MGVFQKESIFMIDLISKKLCHRLLRELPLPSGLHLHFFEHSIADGLSTRHSFPGLRGPIIFYALLRLLLGTAYPGLFRFIPVGDLTVEGFCARFQILNFSFSLG